MSKYTKWLTLCGRKHHIAFCIIFEYKPITETFEYKPITETFEDKTIKVFEYKTDQII